MTDIKFNDLGLIQPLERALEARDHVTPTPIQAQAIPLLLEGRDVMGIAQTGTGKTAAFSLPMLQKLSVPSTTNGPQSPRALILAPTRELAIQIGDDVRAYGKYLHIRQTVIYGGVNQRAQVKALSRGVEIVIATPGRLLDLVKQKRLKLDAVEFFVLDEADRMFDMGFINDVRRIVPMLPESRQSLLFSATTANKMEQLQSEVLTDPVFIKVATQATPTDRIQQTVHHVKSGDKNNLLLSMLKDPEFAKTIIFSRTKHRANRLAEHLANKGIEAEAIHGGKSQGARQRVLKQFRSDSLRVLVATDIAARGIDVDGVTHVINYDLPNESDSYVHRIGRTARAGNTGVAISFCDPTERAYLRDIESLIKQEIEVVGDEPDEEIIEFIKPKRRPRSPRGRKPTVKATNKNTPQKASQPKKKKGTAKFQDVRRKKKKPKQNGAGFQKKKKRAA